MAQETKATAGGNAVSNLVPVFIMGKRYMVPNSLTIQKALEYAGYQLVRGVGCRGGICGACGTVYRKPGSHKIHVALACQTVVEPDMYIAQVPFFPGNRAGYDIETASADAQTVAALYPEIFRCVACNACTSACPMDIKVMDYVNAAIRGDVKAVAKMSFDCVMCGLCSSRCMSEIVQYNVAILCRRLYAAHIAPRSSHLATRVGELESGRYDAEIEELMKTHADALKKLYTAREQEPEESHEEWMPKDKAHL